MLQVASTVTGDECDRDPGVRSEVTSWSAKSRVNMIRTMTSLDWTPVLDVGPGWRPVMLTLTLPGDWLAVAPDGPTFKALVDRFRRRWDREHGPVSWVWKLEFQRRGAPHLHIYTAARTDRAFKEWLSLAWSGSVFGLRTRRRKREDWHDLVARVEREHGRGVADHLRAGTGLDWGEGIRASDPKRLGIYFAKRATGHNLGRDKEYQHQVPEEWRGEGKGPGRFWGYRGLERCTVEVELDDVQFHQLRRLLRRYLRAQGLRVRSLANGGRFSGGMALLNDAPTWLSQAARWQALDAGG